MICKYLARAMGYTTDLSTVASGCITPINGMSGFRTRLSESLCMIARCNT